MEFQRLNISDLKAADLAWVNRTTLLGSAGFARLWETVGGHPVYWTATETDKTVAFLPGVEFGHGRLCRFQSMPDGLYAPFLFPQSVPDRTSLARELAQVVIKRRYARLYINDFYDHLASSAAMKSNCGQTTLIDISTPGWKPPDKKLQSEIRKAERETVALEEFRLNKHFDMFIDLMKRTEQRHGRRPKYPDEFFRELAKLAMTDKRVKWIVCEHDDQLAASHIYLVEGDAVLNWQVYFDKQFSFLKPNQLISYSIAREMQAHGARLLNLGSTPGDAGKLATYKDKWGGHPFQYRCYYDRSWLGRFL
jgi:CelD/BcsL family acetyltransferase involved in cellulose biosynthesis